MFDNCGTHAPSDDDFGSFYEMIRRGSGYMAYHFQQLYNLWRMNFQFPPFPPMQSVDQQGLGYIPSSLCHIHSQEFCGKYFLQSHSENQHKNEHSEGTDSAANVFLSVSSQERISPNRCDSGDQPLGGGFLRKIRKVKTKSTQRLNSMRVQCSICGKKLCNKYFLKTHMKNRHEKPEDDVVQPRTSPHDSAQRIFQFDVDALVESYVGDRNGDESGGDHPAKKFIAHVTKMSTRSVEGYGCRLCGKRVSGLRSIAYHMLLMHEDGRKEELNTFQRFIISEDNGDQIAMPSEINIPVRKRIENSTYLTVRLDPCN